MNEIDFLATAPAGIEPLLMAELTQWGAINLKPVRGGIRFQGTLESAYRACLWSRTASRVLLLLTAFPAVNAEALYANIHDLPWEEHLPPHGTLSIEFNGSCPGINHSHYGAQRVKDAIVDRFRERYGQRPNVDRQQPDLRIHVQIRNDQAMVSLDLSGDSLHRRGYREATVTAPLKETLAASLLLKAGWPDIAAAGGPLLDPLCGSGTLAIEAAWIASDRAPGLLREYWGFGGWLGHIPALWNRLLAEAQERSKAGQSRIPLILASDHDPKAVRAALINADRAGVADHLRIERRELAQIEPPTGPPGLLIANAPYGERLGEHDTLVELYAQLGNRLKTGFTGWQAALFTGNPELGKRMGLRAGKVHVFYNGPLECRLLRFQVEPKFFIRPFRVTAPPPLMEEIWGEGNQQLHSAGDFINRLHKNLRHLGRWAAREEVSCYRLYDADLPEYAVAVDRYEQWLHVQEYAPPASIDPAKARKRLEQVIAALPAVLELPPEQIFLKVRQRQRGMNQYQKQGEQGRFYEVHEGPARFLVNFTDYLDTGLFLDHRITRRRLGELANGGRFLNLFGYTGTATVYAALGGAVSTTTVDLSATYLNWARRNLELNGIRGPQHELIRADGREWLAQARDRYNLIFVDPPTFSNSKRLEDTFDVQRDHAELLHQALRLLAPGGLLIFSTNHRRFRLNRDALAGWRIEDWSRKTLPSDFARDPKIHQCYAIKGER